MKNLPILFSLLALTITTFLVVLRVITPRPVTTTRSEARQSPVTLALFPEKGVFKDKFSVDLLLLNQEKILDGVDVVLNYDPQRLAVEENKVEAGKLFDEVMINKVEPEKGKIRFSTLTLSPKRAQGKLATVHFKVLKPGETIVTFDFVPGATTDSNVAEDGSAQDVLTRVISGAYRLE